MTELEKARAFLRKRQIDLRQARKLAGMWPSRSNFRSEYLEAREAEYLAALSWVWDAQERELADNASRDDIVLASRIIRIQLAAIDADVASSRL
jgi:uncharacterized glyoxalase superfamily metalloenzyme YdcJ